MDREPCCADCEYFYINKFTFDPDCRKWERVKFDGRKFGKCEKFKEGPWRWWTQDDVVYDLINNGRYSGAGGMNLYF